LQSVFSMSNSHLQHAQYSFIDTVAISCNCINTGVFPALHRPILRDVSFTLKQGEWVALLGLNGAGKSSLLRAIAGLLPIQSGELRIYDQVLSRRSLPKLRREVGMLFQGGGLVRQLTALENVLCGCLGERSTLQTLGGFQASDRRKAMELLDWLGLAEQSDQRTGRLSGGQQQRVAIARALMQSPRILLVDEPTTGLDMLAVQQVMDKLAELNHQQGVTLVTVLHDLELAKTFAQRAIVLDAGAIVYDGDMAGVGVKQLIER
jgi:phosphonate transport system ATP-binding protein